MKNLIYILLFFALPVYGQYQLKLNGSTATNGSGSEMRIQEDKLPLTWEDVYVPDPDPPSPDTGDVVFAWDTIYYQTYEGVPDDASLSGAEACVIFEVDEFRVYSGLNATRTCEILTIPETSNGPATTVWKATAAADTFGTDCAFRNDIYFSQWWPDSTLDKTIMISYNVAWKPRADFVKSGKITGVTGPYNEDNSDYYIDDDSTTLLGTSYASSLNFRGSGSDGNWLSEYLWWPERVGNGTDPDHDEPEGAYNPYFWDPENYGTSYLDLDLMTETDTIWHNITLLVTMNTFTGSTPNDDGSWAVFYNEKIALFQNYMTMRTLSTVYHEILRRMWFFGGSTISYAPNREEWIMYDDEFYGQPDTDVATVKYGPGYLFSAGDTIDSPSWPKID